MSDLKPIVTCLSDFGTSDYYVAAMKGVILSIAPQAQIVDVTHDVPAHDVLAGAYVLAGAVRWFPPGSFHLAVVDPGVGSARRIIAGHWGGQIVVAPDNGLVTFLHMQTPSAEIHEVTNREYFRDEVSATFQARDIIAPMIGHLAAGAPLSTVGPHIDAPMTLDIPLPRGNDIQLVGRIIYIDRFGNLITNITAADLRVFGRAAAHVAGRVIGPIARTYSDVPPGQPVALLGSADLLEIAVNQGRASDQLQATVGAEVVLRRL